MTRFGLHTHYETWELRVMRSLFAVVVWTNLERPFVTSMPYPHGIGEFVDLTFLADPLTFAVLKGLLLVPLALFVWGKWFVVSLTYMLTLWVGVRTLEQSQGAIGHSSQIVALVMVAMWLGYAVGPWMWRWGADHGPSRLNVDDLSMYWVHQMVAAAYVLAGISKLQGAGVQLVPLLPRWLIDVRNIPIQLARTHDQAYFNTLDPAIVGQSEHLVDYLGTHAGLASVLFGPGLLLEFLAVFLLLSRAWAAGIGIAIIVFHMLIQLTMGLRFHMNEAVALIFLVNVPYWIAVGAGSLRSGNGREASEPVGAGSHD